jgi:hypothetical protein
MRATVMMPFVFSDGTCVFCHEGLHTSCVQGGFFGNPEVAGAQAEGACSARGRNARRAARRRGRRADAVAAYVVRRERFPPTMHAFYDNGTIGGGPAPAPAERGLQPAGPAVWQKFGKSPSRRLTPGNEKAPFPGLSQ